MFISYNLLGFNLNASANISRAIGAAIVLPPPPCSTTTETTYLGDFKGAKATNIA